MEWKKNKQHFKMEIVLKPWCFYSLISPNVITSWLLSN